MYSSTVLEGVSMQSDVCSTYACKLYHTQQLLQHANCAMGMCPETNWSWELMPQDEGEGIDQDNFVMTTDVYEGSTFALKRALSKPTIVCPQEAQLLIACHSQQCSFVESPSHIHLLRMSLPWISHHPPHQSNIDTGLGVLGVCK